MTDTATGAVDTYSVGLCAASACAPSDMSREDVERAVSMQHPTGLDHGWRISEEPFRNGEANPHPCENDPERSHWLLSC